MMTRFEARNRFVHLLFISFIIFIYFFLKNQYLLLKLYVPLWLSYQSKYPVWLRYILISFLIQEILFANFHLIPLSLDSPIFLLHVHFPDLPKDIILRKEERLHEKITFHGERPFLCSSREWTTYDWIITIWVREIITAFDTMILSALGKLHDLFIVCN